MGGTPVNRRAGNAMKLPPPATAFKTPPRTPATNRRMACPKFNDKGVSHRADFHYGTANHLKSVPAPAPFSRFVHSPYSAWSLAPTVIRGVPLRPRACVRLLAGR